jgi:tetratricopeptide (TPR) repeat protein
MGSSPPKELQARYWVFLGRVREKARDIVGALAAFNESLKLNPDNAEALSRRALARLSKSQLGGASADITRALQLLPKDPTLHVIASNIISRRPGMLKQALWHANQAVALGPDLPMAWCQRARIRIKLHLLTDARQDAERAKSLGDHRHEVWTALGLIELREEAPEQAIVNFNQALELSPLSFQALFLRGRAREITGNLAGARHDFLRVLQISPVRAPVARSARKRLDALGDD